MKEINIFKGYEGGDKMDEEEIIKVSEESNEDVHSSRWYPQYILSVNEEFLPIECEDSISSDVRYI